VSRRSGLLGHRPRVNPSLKNIGLLTLVAFFAMGFGMFLAVHQAYSASAASRAHVAEHMRRADDLRTLERAASREYTGLVAVGALNDLSFYAHYLDGRSDVELSLAELVASAPPGDPLFAALEEISDAHRAVSGVIDGATEEILAGDWDTVSERVDIASIEGVTVGSLATIRSLIEDEHTAMRAAHATDESNQRRLLLALYVAAAVGAATAILVTGLLAHFVVRPFRAVLAGTRAIAAGDHNARIPEFGSTELGTIGSNVNAMAESLLGYGRELNGYLSQNLEARTRELVRRNEDLRREVHARKGTEETLQTALASERRLEQELEFQAFHDSLTDLPNRAMFTDRLSHALKLARAAEEHVALIYIDLDDFKAINDSWGHGDGDEVLRAVASRLEGELAPTDTPARLGGDEFAVLVQGAGSSVDAADLAARLLKAIHQGLALSQATIYPRASIGIAGTPHVEEFDGTELLRRADVAMYFAKSHGKSRVETYSPSMETQLSDRLEMAGDIERGFERGEFFLEYQPTYALASNEICGFEALVRWQHPVHGRQEPDRFISVAEETG
jgi:diguanylate cyclase (GGDEF)-like protein